MFLRPVVPDDAEALADALERADAETIYQRFLRTPVRLDPGQVDRLTRLDYRTRMAIVAFGEDGRGAGIARYEPAGVGTVEVAVVVDPAWRRCGLAAIFLETLESHARRHGVRRLVAVHLPSNQAVIALLMRLGYRIGPTEAGLCTSEKELEPIGQTEPGSETE